jgi:hypothetical protein
VLAFMVPSGIMVEPDVASGSSGFFEAIPERVGVQFSGSLALRL